MKKNLSSIILLSIFILASCSPKVTTRMNTVYDPLPNDSPIEVFFASNVIPKQAEIMGSIIISDSGTSTKCDSATVINRIKEEARKSGGNAVVVLKHIKPSFWGSSCHQMEASVLNVADFTNLASLEEIESENSSSNEYTETLIAKTTVPKKENLLPKFSLSLNGGYGWRTAKLADGFGAAERDFLNKLKRGPVWNASANYYFNDMFGIGLAYTDYLANNKAWGTISDNETNTEGELKTTDRITYVGPSFLMRFSKDQKWIFNVNIGLGYIRYSSNSSLLWRKDKLSGASFGSLYELGVDYKFSKNWGITSSFTGVSGILHSANTETNGIKGKITYPDDQKEGLQHIRLSLGIKYYFQ